MKSILLINKGDTIMLKTSIIERLNDLTSKEYVVDLMRVKGYSIKTAIVYSDFLTLQFHCGNELLFNRYSKIIDVTKGNFTKNIKLEDLEELYNQIKETLEVAKMAKPEADEAKSEEVEEECSRRPKEFDWEITPGGMPFFYNIYHPEVSVKLPRKFAMLQGLIENPPYIDTAKFRNGELIELVLEDKRYTLHQYNGIWKINDNYFEIKEYYDSILNLVERIKNHISEY